MDSAEEGFEPANSSDEEPTEEPEEKPVEIEENPNDDEVESIFISYSVLFKFILS